MKFIVLELQKTNGDVSTIINKYDTLSLAQSAYHQVLSFAAVSNIPYHSAVLMNDEGNTYYRETFAHLEEEPEPEPEPASEN